MRPDRRNGSEGPTSPARRAAFLAFWILLLPLGVGALVVGPQLVVDYPTTGIVAAVVGALVVGFAGWWFLRIRTAQREAGTWSASLKVGLAVGAVLLLAQALRLLGGD